MEPLKVKLLGAGAKEPVCANPGEDLGYDIFCSQAVTLEPGKVHKVKTDVAVELQGYGFLIRDRSSMAAQGIIVSGGVVDAGYRGEIIVMLTLVGADKPVYIGVGMKIAQLVPVVPATHSAVTVVKELAASVRGNAGFGSTGK